MLLAGISKGFYPGCPRLQGVYSGVKISEDFQSVIVYDFQGSGTGFPRC